MNAQILISALWKNKIFQDVDVFSPTHIFSFLDPGFDLTFDSKTPHYKYHFDDLTDKLAKPLDELKLEQIISIFDKLAYVSRDRQLRILLHCHMGISRSTALSYILLNRLLGDGCEEDAFSLLLKISNKPWPNYGLVALADKLCNRGGAILGPLEKYRADHPFRHQAYRKISRNQARQSWFLSSKFFVK